MNIDVGDLYNVKSGPLMSDRTIHNKKKRKDFRENSPKDVKSQVFNEA
jgi:hypothetical protein